ncbi:MAG: hypothetical protein RID53_27870 [Coleofasciculus sp. B1-GNL1-01]|uniref:hypothetical protein n=1 Tax=Coleofasciculus sp. B1-GNL1-01 TaxID=3068484 RepID=UPI0032F780F6
MKRCRFLAGIYKTFSPKGKVSRDLPSHANADEGTIDNFLMIRSINFAITSVVMAGKRHFFLLSVKFLVKSL